MITKRIIPCLDVRNGRVVKGTNFEGIRDVADPVEMARMYNAAGADELVFYDITASFEGRALFTDILTRVASEIFIPLTVGGGINTLEDFDRVLKCGADKVSVNSGALKDPGLIPAAAQRYGNQCVVLEAALSITTAAVRSPGYCSSCPVSGSVGAALSGAVVPDSAHPHSRAVHSTAVPRARFQMRFMRFPRY